MKQIVTSLRPAYGFSTIAHIALQLVFPLLLFVVIRIDLSLIFPIAIVLLSKWRMFAVRPRFWLANIRANAVDIMFGLSVVLFMADTQTLSTQIAWVIAYVIWLIAIKPGSNVLLISLQAIIAYFVALLALFGTLVGDTPIFTYVILVGLISYLTAHHFFDSFDEPYARFLSYVWAFMSAALVWILGHWLLYFGPISQPALVLITLGYGLAGIYYFDHHDKLSRIIKLELVFIVVAIIIINVIALLVSTSNSTII